MKFLIPWALILLSPFAARAAVPAEVRAFDTPNDAGGSITVTWRHAAHLPRGSSYLIAVSTSASGPFQPVAELDAQAHRMSDDPAAFGHGPETTRYHFYHITEGPDLEHPEKTAPIRTGVPYFIQVIARLPEGEFASETLSAKARENFFNTLKTNNFAMAASFSFIILTAIFLARRRNLFIRRIAGLEALDEALGRATEMGKPVLFAHGLTGMGSVSTIAAVNILSRVARRTAEFNTALRVANNDPVVMAVSQEVCKEAYLDAGRPDAYSDDMVFMAATEQFSYAAAVDGMMVRERPAANIMMGYFFAEALLLAETGAATGAIQIAGTDSYTQLPFFITTCDYTLMGEELYAASAYLAREPKLLGSLKGQDIGKLALLAVLVFGTLLATLGIDTVTHMFMAY